MQTSRPPSANLCDTMPQARSRSAFDQDRVIGSIRRLSRRPGGPAPPARWLCRRRKRSLGCATSQFGLLFERDHARRPAVPSRRRHSRWHSRHRAPCRPRPGPAPAASWPAPSASAAGARRPDRPASRDRDRREPPARATKRSRGTSSMASNKRPVGDIGGADLTVHHHAAQSCEIGHRFTVKEHAAPLLRQRGEKRKTGDWRSQRGALRQ